MTGKQLKEYAAQVHDDAVVEVREEGYRPWNRAFEMQAPYVFKSNPAVKATDEQEETRG